ncbi:hypothetical protein [Rhodopirellula sallentina]|uniref:Putative secreted protein n=1 Tax=Rhodopirellula sallentina SM41 TaxID=1263870 RepID=M5TWE9_9BACT|nr:hypothetical protein [Rhodopirellula sallentina]EMI53537.1 putative secreted protein [Rhodopirellula sallentina SM41]
MNLQNLRHPALAQEFRRWRVVAPSLCGAILVSHLSVASLSAQELPGLPALPGMPIAAPPAGDAAPDEDAAVLPGFLDVPITNEAIETMLVDSEIDLNDRAMKANRIYALAEMYRSSRSWHGDFTGFRVRNSIATEMELNVWKQAVDDYFNRRIINLKGIMREKDAYQEKADQMIRIRRNNQRRVLSQIYSNPRYAGKPESVMNELLVGFSNTPIGYGVGLEEYFASNPSHSRWDLSPEMFESLRVKSPKSKGGQLVFSLSDPVPLKLDWWPPVFREKTFQAAIRNVQAARDQLLSLSEQNPQLPIEAINAFDDAMRQLGVEFYSVFPPPWQNMPTERVLELIGAERHLVQLSEEVEAIRDRGTLNAMTRGQYFDPLRDGENAATLIAWMTRNGMEFAPPRPGHEDAYQALMGQMKEMFVIFGEPLPDPEAPLPKTNPRRATDIPRPQ